MSIVCPKCDYVRSKQDDLNTLPGKCPSCGIFYDKFLKYKAAEFQKQTKNSSIEKRHIESSSEKKPETSLIQCSECGKQISRKALSCPNCGAKKEKKSGCRKLVVIFLAANVVVGVISSVSNQKNVDDNSGQDVETAQELIETPEETRDKLIRKQFGWGGYHFELTRIIKESMNDPDSYDHAKTTYSDEGDYLLVKTIFRGKNAFGGVMKNTLIAQVDLYGNVIEILYQGQ